MSDAKKLKALQRRLTFLERRIAERSPQDGGLSWDRGEAAALRWAIETLSPPASEAAP